MVDRKKIQGRSSCHISWDYSASHLVVVSYWDSKLTTFPVDDEGMVGEAVEVWTQPGAEYVDTHSPDRWEHLAHRQRWPHLHQVELSIRASIITGSCNGNGGISCSKAPSGGFG